MQEPHTIRWSAHALDKATRLGFARADVEDLVLNRHSERRRNPGAAEWTIAAGWVTVAYDWPEGDDPTVARIVTLWRPR